MFILFGVVNKYIVHVQNFESALFFLLDFIVGRFFLGFFALLCIFFVGCFFWSLDCWGGNQDGFYRFNRIIYFRYLYWFFYFLRGDIRLNINLLYFYNIRFCWKNVFIFNFYRGLRLTQLVFLTKTFINNFFIHGINNWLKVFLLLPFFCRRFIVYLNYIAHSGFRVGFIIAQAIFFSNFQGNIYYYLHFKFFKFCRFFTYLDLLIF